MLQKTWDLAYRSEVLGHRLVGHRLVGHRWVIGHGLRSSGWWVIGLRSGTVSGDKLLFHESVLASFCGVR